MCGSSCVCGKNVYFQRGDEVVRRRLAAWGETSLSTISMWKGGGNKLVDQESSHCPVHVAFSSGAGACLVDTNKPFLLDHFVKHSDKRMLHGSIALPVHTNLLLEPSF